MHGQAELAGNEHHLRHWACLPTAADKPVGLYSAVVSLFQWKAPGFIRE
jgi:hypothetical protein